MGGVHLFQKAHSKPQAEQENAYASVSFACPSNQRTESGLREALSTDMPTEKEGEGRKEGKETRKTTLKNHYDH